MKFAEQKEKRLSGLAAAHAIFPIITGKLGGFNYKIKVAKRIIRIHPGGCKKSVSGQSRRSFLIPLAGEPRLLCDSS